jgi:hypothetical protein
MVKHLITGGCSFSAGGEYTGWTGALSSHMKTINPEVTCNHTGYQSQGQEMIQKKVMLALTEAFTHGYKPEDILVVVMWSGTCRKAWYIDNHYIINEIISYLPKFVGGMSKQFLDMKDKVVGTTKYFSTALSDGFEYNPDGGWFFTVNGSECQIEFVQQHYLLDKKLNGTGKVHTSLENIIMLQNFCDLHKVPMIQQFFMDSVYEDIENKKDHQIINYLYNQLNINNMIKIGMFEYLHNFLNCDKDPQILTHSERKKLSGDTDIFDKDGFHPGPAGHQLWVDNIIVPFLKDKNII